MLNENARMKFEKERNQQADKNVKIINDLNEKENENMNLREQIQEY